jgi:hypothetical protein
LAFPSALGLLYEEAILAIHWARACPEPRRPFTNCIGMHVRDYALRGGGVDPSGLPSPAFAVRENAKRELSFFLAAARAASQSPKGSKAAGPPADWRRCSCQL